MCFGLGRSTDRTTVAYYRPSRSTDPLAGVVHAVHACRLTDRSTANPSGRSTDRLTGSTRDTVGGLSTGWPITMCNIFFDKVSSTRRSTEPLRLVQKWTVGRPAGRLKFCQKPITASFQNLFFLLIFPAGILLSLGQIPPLMTWWDKLIVFIHH